jgi:hypothetical protein
VTEAAAHLPVRFQQWPLQRILKDGISVDELIDTKTNFDSMRLIVVDENSGRIGSVTLPMAVLRRPS